MRRLVPVAALCLLFAIAVPTPAHAQQLLGPGKMFVRFTNLRPDEAKVLIRVNVVPNHDKWFGWNGKTVYVAADGADDKEALPADRWLSPGQASPWIDVGQYMNLRGTRSPDLYLSPVLCGVRTEGKAAGLHLLAEVAEAPGTKVLRRVEVHKPGLKDDGERDYPWKIGFGVWNGGATLPTLGLLIPTRPDIAGRVFTLEESLRWQLDAIEEFPVIGREAEKFVFVARGRPEVMKALGYRGYPEGTVEGNLGDEIGLHLSMKPEEQAQRFREHLKAKGLDPLELVPDAQLEKAKALPAEERWSLVALDPLPDKPKQFYESADFRYRLWYDELAKQTREIEAKNPGKRVLTGANYSPHMNVWPDVRQWVAPFKANAMTMSWTEDWWWQLPETSPQGYGFLLDALRLAGSYHGAPIQFYVMPFQGNSPDNFRKMHGLAVAHGAKIFNHFVIEDQTLITWDYVDQTLSPTMFQAISDVIRDAGATENRLYPAMPRKAQIAILLSRASDTWDTEDLGGAGHLYGAKHNANNEERKSIWLALRHAQLPVDLVTDEDVAEGKLKDYKVLYVVGSEMLAAAAEPLKQWVNDGGFLYGTGGGGLLDEYHRPQNAVLEVFGLKGHDLQRESRLIRPRAMLRGSAGMAATTEAVEGAAVPEAVAPGAANSTAAKPLPRAQVQPLDVLTVRGPEGGEAVKLPAFLYRETLTLADPKEAIGTFGKNDAAAASLHRFGKGSAMYVGALAGLAYVQPAETESAQVLPTAFSAPVRKLLTAPARLAGVRGPIEASYPLVEAQLMEGAGGAAIALVNWTDKPLQGVVIRFPGVKAEKVRSLRAAGVFRGNLDEAKGGLLKVEVVDGVPQVKLDLATTDYLMLN